MLLTIEQFAAVFGEEECLQIAGTGARDRRELDRQKIEEALVHASGIVIGYVRDRWPEAVNGTPMLAGFAADIARWRLRGRGGQQSAMNETVKQRYDEAIARLKDIAGGRLTLDVSGQTDASDELNVSTAIRPDRVTGVLQGWRP